MSCTQHMQLVRFPKVRVDKHWFRYFNDHKDFKNDGNLHLFSLMALYSYANFRSNTRTIADAQFLESPGEWICKLSALPRVLRARSKAHALEVMDYLNEHGFLTYEVIGPEVIRFHIADWQRHCVHLNYNYYSYKGSGFFFFPLPVGRLLITATRKEGKVVMSELDAIMDLWLHTIHQDQSVEGSDYMPVVYYANMGGKPLLSYAYLAKRWGWSKSRVGRFILKLEEAGVIERISFTSSRGSIISICRYREMLYGADCEQLSLQRIGEILGIAKQIGQLEESTKIEMTVQLRVPSCRQVKEGGKALQIQVFQTGTSSFFARPTPLIFYSSTDWGKVPVEKGTYKGEPKIRSPGERS